MKNQKRAISNANLNLIELSGLSHNKADKDEYMKSFLYTKVSIPQSSSSTIIRKDLEKKIGQVISKKLTLVVAPAGYGKTTMVSAWANQIKNKYRIAWVSIDKKDNDCKRFWKYIMGSLHNYYPETPENALTAFDSVQLYPLESIINVLINMVSNSNVDTFIVLDDYHLIQEPELHNSIEYLIEYLPNNMHLIILSRLKPSLSIAKMRLEGELLEIDVKDMQLSLHEINDFLNLQMELNLTKDEIKKIEIQTEGWIAALKIVAQSLKTGKGSKKHIDSLNMNNCNLMEYLTEEIINYQPQHIINFLYSTSILSVLNSAICNAVAGINNGQEILDELTRNNLFIVALDDKANNYRYHPLFADYLESRLNAIHHDKVKELYLKASNWYEENGIIEEAIEYSMKAKAHDNTIRIIEKFAHSFFKNNAYDKIISYLDAVPVSILHENPRVFVLYTLAKSFLGQAAMNEACIGNESINLDDEIFIGQEFEIAVIRSNAALNREDIRIEDVIKYSCAALEFEIPLNTLHTDMHSNLAFAYAYLSDFIKSEHHYRKAIVIAEKFDRSSKALYFRYNIAMMKINNGQLDLAMSLFKEAINIMTEKPHVVFQDSNSIYLGIAYLYYEFNNLELARTNVEESIEQSKVKHDSIRLMKGYTFLAKILFAENRYIEALNLIKEIDKTCINQELRFVLSQSIWDVVRILISMNNIDYAKLMLEKYQFRVHEDKSFVFEEEHSAIAELWILEEKYAEAVELLDSLLLEAKSFNRYYSIIKMLLLKTISYHKWGRHDDALTALDEALYFSYDKKYLRLFLDFGENIRDLLLIITNNFNKNNEKLNNKILDYAFYIISHFNKNSCSSLPKSNDGLRNMRPKELEVLKYLYAGYSNQEIADKIYVSVSSVKKYLQSIYEKLNVKNRTQAIAVIRQYNIIKFE